MKGVLQVWSERAHDVQRAYYTARSIAPAASDNAATKSNISEAEQMERDEQRSTGAYRTRVVLQWFDDQWWVAAVDEVA